MPTRDRAKSKRALSNMVRVRLRVTTGGGILHPTTGEVSYDDRTSKNKRPDVTEASRPHYKNMPPEQHVHMDVSKWDGQFWCQTSSKRCYILGSFCFDFVDRLLWIMFTGTLACNEFSPLPSRLNGWFLWTFTLKVNLRLLDGNCAMKPVCNDHLYNKTYYLRFIQ